MTPMLAMLCTISLALGFLVAAGAMLEFATEGNLTREIAIVWTLIGVLWPVLLVLILIVWFVLMILVLATSVPAEEPE